MPPRTSPALGQLGVALRTLVLLTVVLGLAYPLLMTAIAQVGFADNANGSRVKQEGRIVGSSLIGQDFTRPVEQAGQPFVDENGLPVFEPDPAYFQSRPSAAGTGYDPLSSSASNLAPSSPELLALVEERRAAVAELNGINPADVAPDALLASGSGLDPDISPKYAEQQAIRVARERGLDEGVVQQLVQDHTDGRVLGFLGEPRVNVLALNLALDELED
jgi:K+-transporting ATPase ATPase C chain